MAARYAPPVDGAISMMDNGTRVSRVVLAVDETNLAVTFAGREDRPTDGSSAHCGRE